MHGRLWPAVLGAAGLLISAYLVGTHYFADEIPLACSTGGIVDCEQVTNSAESMVGPMPVAVLGLVWFAVFLGILAIRSWLPELRSKALLAQVVWASVGLVTVFYLVYVELFLIGALCLWCTAIHAIVVVLFLMTLWDATEPTPSSSENVGDRLRTLG